jgi:hypothetical protein
MESTADAPCLRRSRLGWDADDEDALRQSAEQLHRMGAARAARRARSRGGSGSAGKDR